MCKADSANERQIVRRQRMKSHSLTESSQIYSKRANSISADVGRTVPKTDSELDPSVTAPFRGPSTGGPVISFADFLADTTGEDDETNDQQKPPESPTTSAKDNPIST